MKKIFTLTFITLFSSCNLLTAQMVTSNTTPYNTAANLVNNILLGQGVSAANITFSGNPNQIGFFNNGNTLSPSLGLDSGIVMSTGNINDIPVGGIQPSEDFNGPADNDLLLIAQSVQAGINTTNDAAALEFDFTPQGDTVEFRFVFASDEYHQWINTVYNDIFAFFISGPGITGPYASPAAFPNGAINIAQVPGTSDPITISTIHPGLNSQFFVDNPNEANNEFNGFSTVITIKQFVQCGQTYHFKLAVADCQDGTLDTGVFLEGSSFSSEAVEVSVVTATGDSTVIEGCADATINFTRPDTVGDVTVHFDIGGNAINGTDYDLIADSITFLAGQNTAVLTINPIADFDFTEGQDTISITAYTINACGDTIVSTGYIYILDLPNMVLSSHDTILDCPLANLPIYVEATQALEPFTYNWTDAGGNPIGSNNDTIMIAGMVTDTFYISVTDSCNLVTLNDTIIVTVDIPLLEFSSASSDTTIHCGESVTLNALATGGTPNYTYNYTPFGPIVSPQTTTSYTVTATDACSVSIDSVITITVDTVPVLITSLSSDTTINCGESVTLQANATNGNNTPQYQWNGITGNPITVSPQTSTSYFLEITGFCNANVFDTVTITVDTIPVSISTTNITLFCNNETINIGAAPTDGTSLYTYNWGPNGTGDSITVSPNQTTTYYVTANGGCGASANDSLTVTVDYTPMTLNLSDSITLRCPNLSYPVEIVATVANGTAPYNYNWNASTDTDSIINFTASSAQTVTVTVFDNCNSQISGNMYIVSGAYIPMVLNILPIDSVCVGENITISSTATDGIPPYNFSWTDGVNSYSGNPINYVSETAGINTIDLTVSDQCTSAHFDSDVLVIPCAVNIPNVISPNGDLNNDFLVFENLEFFPNNKLQIFNRWGKKIYEKEGYQNDWYGKEYSEGTYYFILELNNFDSTIHKGSITLLKQ
ncbi:MAG: choice-of-anchor L domain-containing protein [Vicingaceae bacterium]